MPESSPLPLLLAFIAGAFIGPKLLRAGENLLGPSESEKRMARRLQRSGVRVKKRYRRYR